MYDHFAGGVSSRVLDFINSEQIKAGINTLTDESGYMFQPNKVEMQQLTDIMNIINWRNINFKQFLSVMLYHQIFNRWNIKKEGLLSSGLKFEDIQAGLKQCSLPIIKGFFRKYSRGMSMDGIKLYDYEMIFRSTIATEMEVCYDI